MIIKILNEEKIHFDKQAENSQIHSINNAKQYLSNYWCITIFVREDYIYSKVGGIITFIKILLKWIIVFFIQFYLI